MHCFRYVCVFCRRKQNHDCAQYYHYMVHISIMLYFNLDLSKQYYIVIVILSFSLHFRQFWYPYIVILCQITQHVIFRRSWANLDLYKCALLCYHIISLFLKKWWFIDVSQLYIHRSANCVFSVGTNYIWNLYINKICNFWWMFATMHS